MSKLTKDDLALWNFYKSNFTVPSKKIEVENFPKKNKNKIKEIPRSNKNNLILEDRIKKTLKNKKFLIDAFLDLHGLNQKDAKRQIKEFVRNAFLKKKRHVIVITGKGENNKGALKRQTPIWLSEEEISKYIIGYSISPQSLGGDGAIYINVKNINKYKSY